MYERVKSIERHTVWIELHLGKFKTVRYKPSTEARECEKNEPVEERKDRKNCEDHKPEPK